MRNLEASLRNIQRPASEEQDFDTANRVHMKARAMQQQLAMDKDQVIEEEYK
jgi:hypothetical protein